MPGLNAENEHARNKRSTRCCWFGSRKKKCDGCRVKKSFGSSFESQARWPASIYNNWDPNSSRGACFLGSAACLLGNCKLATIFSQSWRPEQLQLEQSHKPNKAQRALELLNPKSRCSCHHNSASKLLSSAS
jgi:hypothetical protein